MNINIGSGIHPAPGWVNVDANAFDGWQVDVMGSALALPFADHCADRVYFGHMLEHLTYDDAAPTALVEASRVLRPGGELAIVGPAMDLAIATKQPQWLLDDIAAHPGQAGLGHQWTATVDTTLDLVRSVFDNARVVDVATIHRSTHWPNTVIDPWQVAIVASTPVAQP